MSKKTIFTCALLLLLSSPLLSQDQAPSGPASVTVEKKDGTMLKGKLLGVANDSATFQDENDQVYRLPMADIRNIRYEKAGRKRNEWYASPNVSRYLFAPTAFPLQKGEISLQSTYIFINSVQFGLTDRISIAGGGDLFGGTITFLNTKFNLLNTERHKFSAGLSYYRLPEDFIETYSGEDVRNMGMIYGASTWGNRNSHFSVGAGYVYIAKGFLPPIVTVSGTLRVAKRFAFLTENWVFFVGERIDIPVVISLGGRYISKRSTVDIAFYSDHESAFDNSQFYINYTIKLGRR